MVEVHRREIKGLVDNSHDHTESVAFKPGRHNRVAVRVVDPRGSEVMSVTRVDELSRTVSGRTG